MEVVDLASVMDLDNDSLRGELSRLIHELSVLRGDFTLKSGKKSTWFIDGKQVVCHPAGVLLNAVAMMRLMDEFFGTKWPDSIGGLTMGADPVSFSVAAISSAVGRPIRAFSVRKEAKDHGGGGRIAGSLSLGDRVVVTEDVVSRGTSMLEAVRAVSDAGGKVVLALAMVDRGGSVETLLAGSGVPFRAIFTADELGLPFEGGLD